MEKSSSISSLQDKLLLPSIPIGFLDDVLQASRHRDLDVEGLLRENGLSSHRLQVSGHRISVDLYSRVIRELRHRTDDAFLGFLSRPIPRRAFNVFAYGVVGCRSLREVINQANDFYSLFCDDFHWRLEENDGDVLLVVHIIRVLDVDYRFIIQSLLLMAVRLFGWLLGEDIEAKSVSFSFPKNVSDDNLTYLFGHNIQYDSDGDFIRLDNSYCQAKLSCTRDQVALMLQNKRNLFLISRRKKPLAQEVRRRLLLSRSEKWLEIDDVAAELGISKNQLWRKLTKEDTGFLEIRDQIKRDWALILIEDTAMTIEQVADTLRFSDVRAFRKAFTRWTGIQPIQYRDDLFK